MNILDYGMVEKLAAACTEFWQYKNLDYLLKKHFAGDTTAMAYIELMYINLVLEPGVYA